MSQSKYTQLSFEERGIIENRLKNITSKEKQKTIKKTRKHFCSRALITV